MPIETCEEDEDFGRDCDAGDRDEERCDQCGQTSGCLLNGLCPMCYETGGGVLHRLTHIDARPDHVRRAEDAAWRENEAHERARI